MFIGTTVYGPYGQAAMCATCMDGFYSQWKTWIEPAPTSTGPTNSDSCLVCKTCGGVSWRKAIGRKKAEVPFFFGKRVTTWQWRDQDLLSILS